MPTRNSRLVKTMRPRQKVCVPIRVILRFRELWSCWQSLSLRTLTSFWKRWCFADLDMQSALAGAIRTAWASAWDFQQCGMCDQQSLRSACAYTQSDQSLFYSLEYSMSVKLLTKHHLEFLSLKGGFTVWYESTHVKMPHCWKSHVTAQHVIYRLMEGGDQESPRWHEGNWWRTTAVSGSSRQSTPKEGTPWDQIWDLLCVQLNWCGWCPCTCMLIISSWKSWWNLMIYTIFVNAWSLQRERQLNVLIRSGEPK